MLSLALSYLALLASGYVLHFLLVQRAKLYTGWFLYSAFLQFCTFI